MNLRRSIAQPRVEFAAERLTAKPDDNFVFGAFHEGKLVGMAGFFRYQIAKARHKGKNLGCLCACELPRAGHRPSVACCPAGEDRACPGVEQVSLTVVSGQEAARALYRSLGFERYGMELRGLKVGDCYFDNEHMVLLV